MAEDIQGSVPKMGRRDAFKKAFKVGAGIMGAALGWRELHIMTEGIETEAGIFYPLYEAHIGGILVKDLPDQLDGFFREVIGGDFYFREKPSKIIRDILIPREIAGLPAIIIKKEVIEALSRNKTRIIFGDIEVGEKLRESSKVATQVRVGIGAAAIAGGLAWRALEKDIIGLWESAKDKKAVSRREFLTKAAVGLGGIAVTPFASEVLGAGLALAGINIDQKNAIQRIYWRLNGLLHHLSPEDHLIFFRNLVFADKLLTASEVFHQELGRKVRIAFNVGAGHAGIEDFLIAGHDFTRWFITRYPKEFLQEVAEANGGIENVCALRSLTLPPDFKIDSLGDIATTATSVASETFDNAVKDQRVIDEQLLQALKGKLAADKQG